MEMLGINAQTLYAYVSRKGIRSRPVPGTRQRRYWRADIEQLRKKKTPLSTPKLLESDITLFTDADLFYRGHNAVDLSRTSSFESVAALLWGVEEKQVFNDTPLQAPALWASLNRVLKAESQVNRATALFPFIEDANPKSHDLSHAGIARTGADILRWFAAITVHAELPGTEPIHQFIGRELKLDAVSTELVRRTLILAADHGFEPGTLAVRSLAGNGTTPWRAVLGGLSVTLGSQSRIGVFDAADRLMSEIIAGDNPRGVIMKRLSTKQELPGFSSSVYPFGDPRAKALLTFCDEALAGDEAYQRLKEALQTVKEMNNQEPAFALACIFVGTKIHTGHHDSIFHLGRTAGWIAHTIEQYQHRVIKRPEGIYKGLLP